MKVSIKKVVLMTLIVIGCGLVISICTSIRGNFRFNATKKEMIERMGILASETNSVCLAELTPFIWDEAYIYGGYSTPEDFEELMGEMEAEYIETMEFDHREIYYSNDSIVFDSKVLNYYDWRLHPNSLIDKDEVLFTPKQWLELKLGEEGTLLLYY